MGKIKIKRILELQEKLLQMVQEHKVKPEQKVKVFTLAQVAEIFSVTLRTIYNWKDQGILPCTIIGSKCYLTQVQLVEFLKQHEVKPNRRL